MLLKEEDIHDDNVVINNTSKKHYVGAVVEYAPVILESPKETIAENADQYVSIIANASNYGVDIIVFPEYGLTGVHLPSDRDKAKEYLIEIPSPKNKCTPSLDPNCDEILKKLSSAAKSYKIYVTVNLLEIQYDHANGDENNVDDDEHNYSGNQRTYFYNTNVVFDREGVIIARYRKFNLFVEKAFDAPKEPELCTFTTDFGVTFGMFICFDILFNDPSVKLVKEKQVTDIVYSTAWFSELPLLTAVSTQAAWAYSLNVNLLAAGYNCPEMTGGGSGIYAGTEGPVVVIMPKYKGTRILIAIVQKKNSSIMQRDSALIELLEDGGVDDEIIPLEEEEELLERSHNRKRGSSLIISENNSVNMFNDMRFLNDISVKSFQLQPLSAASTFEELGNGITLHTNTLTYEDANFSCHIEVKWKEDADSRDVSKFKLMAYSGDRNFSIASVNHIEACGMILCTDETPNMCNILPDVDLTKYCIEIESIRITAKSYNTSSIPVPATLNSSLYPINVSSFNFHSSIQKENERDFYEVEMNLINPMSDLVTFAIYKLPSSPSSINTRTR